METPLDPPLVTPPCEALGTCSIDFYTFVICMMKGLLTMYNYTPCTDPINVGEEIFELRAKMSNIEQMMDRVLTKLSATAQPNPQSQPDSVLLSTPSLSIADDDLDSIFSFCTSSPFHSPSFHSLDFASPPLLGPSYIPSHPLFPSRVSPQLDRAAMMSSSLPPSSLPPLSLDPSSSISVSVAASRGCAA